MSDAEHDDLLLNATETEGLPMDGLLAELLGNWGDIPEAEQVETAAEQPSEHTPLSALMDRLLEVEEPAAEPLPEESSAELFEPLPPFAEAPVEPTLIKEVSAEEPVTPQANIPRETVESEPPPVTVVSEFAATLPEPEPRPEPEPEPRFEAGLQPEPEQESAGDSRDDGALRGLLSVMRRELAQSEPARHREPPRAETHQRERFLAFGLAGESYAVALTRVLETDRLPKVTRVPGLPDYVRGVCNLRGAVLAVVDLRRLLHLDETAPARDERILVIKPAANDTPVALIVDSLLGVSLLAREELHRTPQWLEGKITPFLDGIGTHKGKLVSVLDLDRVFTAAELREAPAA
jgi:purine-binding chemotaxis protein CheW